MHTCAQKFVHTRILTYKFVLTNYCINGMSGVEKGDRVLEIGCDVGLTTAALASRAGDKLVIGLDKSRKVGTVVVLQR